MPVELVNGSELTPLQLLQQRVAQAALAQNMNPQGAALSAYVNGILQTARLNALQEILVNPPNATWSMQEAIDAAVARHLTQTAEALEAQAQRPRIAMPGH